MDRKNEREIQHTLDEFSKNRTTIAIAHRLSTIKNSEIIYCIESGKVAEFGSHEELMRNEDGVYHKLVHYQFAGSDDLQDIQEEAEEEQEQQQIFEEKEAVDMDLPQKVSSTINDGMCDEPQKQSLIKKVFQRQRQNTNQSGSEDQSRKSSVLEALLDTKKKDSKTAKVPYAKLWADITGHKHTVLIGCLFSVGAAFIFPGLGYVFSDMLEALMLLSSPIPQLKDQGATKAWHVAIYFGCYALGALVSYSVMNSCFVIAGEHLTKNIRKKLFRKFMFTDIEFFDKEENSVGQCTERLFEDAKVLNS